MDKTEVVKTNERESLHAELRALIASSRQRLARDTTYEAPRRTAGV